MKNIIGAIALVLAFMPAAYAADETVGDKAHEVKQDAVKAKRATGKEVRKAGRTVKNTIVTHCADGRRTIKGAHGCVGHGGVRDTK
jgi:hypothetical protein